MSLISTVEFWLDIGKTGDAVDNLKQTSGRSVSIPGVRGFTKIRETTKIPETLAGTVQKSR